MFILSTPFYNHYLFRFFYAHSPHNIHVVFIAFLLNNTGISVSTTPLIIFTSILAKTEGKITVFKDFNFTPLTNLKVLVPTQVGIFFSFLDKVSRKQSSHFFPHTVVVAPESKIAELMVCLRKVELSSFSWLSNTTFTISSQVLVALSVW